VDHVAPRAGAWVETGASWGQGVAPCQSHPVRVRGLKHIIPSGAHPYLYPSHPVRVRGLKREWTCQICGTHHVAPRAGAWVETNTPNILVSVADVAPRAGAWVETPHWAR